MSEPAGNAGRPVRLAHFSDIHLSARPLGFRLGDRFGKRATGWVNLRLLGRGRRFRFAVDVLGALALELATGEFDRLVFSGDATMMGFDSEFAAAVAGLGVGLPDGPAGLAVPGNHDVYVPRVVHQRRFEHYFADWQHGWRVDGHAYPFALDVGGVWLIGVNSARPNRWFWDASGGVGREQRERLAKLLSELGPGVRVLVTHYPLCREDGRPEPRWHGLRDWREMLEIAREGKVGLWLSGHRHVGYRFGPTAEIPFPVVCAGSATQSNRWAYNRYTITGRRLFAERRVYSPERQQYEDTDQWELDLVSG